jgi:multidrug efflux pump subunit AcrA (membrane-fusion protein)
VYVKVVDHVVQGAPLFTLDERDVDAQIKTLKASLESSKIQLKDAVSQFSLVKNMEDSPAVSRDDFNRRKYAAEFASKRLEEAQFLLDQAQTTKERLTIKAPISGEILYLNVRPGELAVASNLSDPLMSMGDMSALHVRVEIDEENASLIDSKSPAIGMNRSDTKTEIPLEFVRFEPYVKPKKNLAAAGQRVDTRVLQIIYRIGHLKRSPFVGQQMDVFIQRQASQ